MAEFAAAPPAIGSFLLASTDPGRLRGWYESAFGVTAVAELRQRGVAFEDVNAGGLRTVNGIAEVTGNYPSAGGGSGPPGSATARATFSAQARRSRLKPGTSQSGARHRGGSREASEGCPTRRQRRLCRALATSRLCGRRCPGRSWWAGARRQ